MDERDPFDGAPLGLRRAGLFIRIVGKVCDGLCFGVLAATAAYLRDFASARPTTPSATFVLVAVTSWTIAVIVLESRRGYSPGKYIVGLRVRNFDGTVPRLSQAIARNAYAFVGSVPLLGRYLGLPALAAIAFTIWRDPDGRGWHDRVAGVIVVQIPPPTFDATAGIPDAER